MTPDLGDKNLLAPGESEEEEGGRDQAQAPVQLGVGGVAGHEPLQGQRVPLQQVRQLLPHEVLDDALHHGQDQGHDHGEGGHQRQEVEEAPLEPGPDVGRPRGVVLVDRLVHQRLDGVAVLLQTVECVLYGLVYGLLYVFTHFLDLVHTAYLKQQDEPSSASNCQFDTN